MEEIKQDNKGNNYINLNNLRITYVRQETRDPDRDWAGADMIRIQAYTGNGSQLHRGAEIPVTDVSTFIELIESLTRLYRARIEDQNSSN